MINAWSLLYDEMNGTIDKTYPIKEDVMNDDKIEINTGIGNTATYNVPNPDGEDNRITSLESDEYDPIVGSGNTASAYASEFNIDLSGIEGISLNTDEIDFGVPFAGGMGEDYITLPVPDPYADVVDFQVDNMVGAADTINIDTSSFAGGVTFGDLTVRFMIDEELKNYYSVHNWIRTYGLSEQRTAEGTKDLYSNARLFILTSHQNVNHVVEFKNMFPISLSGVPFDATVGDVDYLLADVTFKYEKYDILNEKHQKFE